MSQRSSVRSGIRCPLKRRLPARVVKALLLPPFRRMNRALKRGVARKGRRGSVCVLHHQHRNQRRSVLDRHPIGIVKVMHRLNGDRVGAAAELAGYVRTHKLLPRHLLVRRKRIRREYPRPIHPRRYGVLSRRIQGCMAHRLFQVDRGSVGKLLRCPLLRRQRLRIRARDPHGRRIPYRGLFRRLVTDPSCMMLENCCYGYNETLILRMIHGGEFGDVLYGEGAYIHDLRAELFSNAGEGLWRRTEHTQRNGNLYPTHGLGPVANYMGVQRGDRFDYIVSMSSPQRGLDQYRKDHLKPDDPRWAERYLTGDMNTSLIKTAKGLTITVKHAVSTPHPYDRINLIAGTKGLLQDYPPRIYCEGMNKDEDFEPIDINARRIVLEKPLGSCDQ